MENRSIILHISDLHIGLEENDNCRLMDKSYVKNIIDTINEMKVKVHALIISGDIVDKGIEDIKYDTAYEIIDSLCKELAIDKKSVFIVPGNHDVNLQQKGKDKETYLNYRYKSFIEFTSKFDQDIDIQKPVVAINKWENERVIFIGVNSNKVVDSSITEPKQLNKGKIEDDELDKQVKECIQGHEDWMKVLVMHHWPSAYKGELASTLESNNIPLVKRVFDTYKINLVLCGHVHGSTSTVDVSFKENEHYINYCCVGSIGAKFNDEVNNSRHNSFNIIDLASNRIKQYKLFKDENEEKWVLWDDRPIKKMENERFVLEKGEDGDEDTREDGSISVTTYKEKILELIKKYQLYKSGHFHGNGKARLGWIDTQYLLVDNKCRKLVVEGINERLKTIITEPEKTCIIGLGIKGNLIASYIRYYWNKCEFDYFPDSERSHIEYEKYIHIEKEYKKIIILTDTVYSGKTITRCIDKIKEKIKCDIEAVCILYVQRDQQLDSFNIRTNDSYEIKLNCLCSMGMPICSIPNPLECNIAKDNLEVIYKIN